MVEIQLIQSQRIAEVKQLICTVCQEIWNLSAAEVKKIDNFEDINSVQTT